MANSHADRRRSDAITTSDSLTLTEPPHHGHCIAARPHLRVDSRGVQAHMAAVPISDEKASWLAVKLGDMAGGASACA
jgi:hypothetical protein